MIDDQEKSASSDSYKLLRFLYREVARKFIDASPELVWVHAGCAAGEDGAVLMPGRWGHGKSTLTLELHRRGLRYVSDDLVPIDPATGKALPFACSPQVRRSSAGTLSREQVSGLPKFRISLQPEDVAQEPQLLAMLVFPTFAENEQARLTSISPAQAAGQLLENCISFPNNSDATIQSLCGSIEELPMYNLVFGNAEAAGDLIMAALAQDKEKITEFASERG